VPANPKVVMFVCCSFFARAFRNTALVPHTQNSTTNAQPSKIHKKGLPPQARPSHRVGRRDGVGGRGHARCGAVVLCFCCLGPCVCGQAPFGLLSDDVRYLSPPLLHPRGKNQRTQPKTNTTHKKARA
jgi:hypothetical protein